MKVVVINRKRSKICEEIEGLSLWIVMSNRLRATINEKIIQKKASSLFEDMNKKPRCKTFVV